MIAIDETTKQRILEESLRSQLTRWISTEFHVVKASSPLVCDCGGPLLRVYRVLKGPKPPYHRKKRVQKKWKKRWLRAEAVNNLARAAGVLINRPVYECSRCNRVNSMYTAIANNIFKIEPLPDGALPIYDVDSPMIQKSGV